MPAKEIFDALKAPFPADAIDWRVGQSGTTRAGAPWAKVLAYLTARAVMDRLDEAVGPDKWWDEYRAGPQGGVICGLTVEVDGKAVTRWDGAENTDIESVKGGLSDAFKRAAVKHGIGRYLYDLGDTFAKCETEKQKGDGWSFAKTKDGTQFWWHAPGLPAEFLPSTKPAPKPPQNGKREAAMAAAPGKLKPASQLDTHSRGDNFDWHQWTSPPPEVRDSETPHPWYLQAVKGLMHHIGAASVGNARKVFAWLSPDDPIDVKEAKENPLIAQIAWQKLCDKSNTVPFERMLHEAMERAEAA